MSTTTAIRQSTAPSALRRLAARHPMAAFLIMAFTVSITLAFVRLRTNGDIQSQSYQYTSGFLEHLFSVALPAFLVVAAMYGGAGVRDLARRSFRWRVGLLWYFLALLGLPIGVMLCASVIYGLAPLMTLVDKWQLLFTLILPNLLIRIVFLNTIEEIGWLGFLQARLQDKYGPLKAVVLTEIPFALWHLPFLLVDTNGGVLLALGFLGILATAQLFGRVVIMWLYNNTYRSVLLVGLFHAAHNTTINRFTAEFITAPAEIGFLITEGAVVAAAVLLIIFTKGRLSYKADHVSQIPEAQMDHAT